MRMDRYSETNASICPLFFLAKLEKKPLSLLLTTDASFAIVAGWLGIKRGRRRTSGALIDRRMSMTLAPIDYSVAPGSFRQLLQNDFSDSSAVGRKINAVCSDQNERSSTQSVSKADPQRGSDGGGGVQFC